MSVKEASQLQFAQAPAGKENKVLIEMICSHLLPLLLFLPGILFSNIVHPELLFLQSWYPNTEMLEKVIYMH